MARYTFTCEHFDYDMFRGEENGVASTHITQFRADDLTTMLENFESFLRGAGFHFDGVIDVVSVDDGKEDLRAIDDFVAEQRSERVMDHIVKDLMGRESSFKTEVELDNMNASFVAGSSDWDTGAAMPTFRIDDTIDLSDITISSLNTDPVFSEQYSFDFSATSDKCEVCSLPKSVMSIHKCYDDNCPLYAVKN
jgi:hypothetical protein